MQLIAYKLQLTCKLSVSLRTSFIKDIQTKFQKTISRREDWNYLELVEVVSLNFYFYVYKLISHFIWSYYLFFLQKLVLLIILRWKSKGKKSERESTERGWGGNNPVTGRERGDGGAHWENFSNAFISTHCRWVWPHRINALYSIDIGGVDRRS